MLSVSIMTLHHISDARKLEIVIVTKFLRNKLNLLALVMLMEVQALERWSWLVLLTWHCFIQSLFGCFLDACTDMFVSIMLQVALIYMTINSTQITLNICFREGKDAQITLNICFREGKDMLPAKCRNEITWNYDMEKLGYWEDETASRLVPPYHAVSFSQLAHMQLHHLSLPCHCYISWWAERLYEFSPIMCCHVLHSL